MMDAPPPLSRVRWLCRRGMLELDRLLGDYAVKRYDAMSIDAKDRFVRLLAFEDDQLWDWFTERAVPPDPELEELVAHIRDSR